MSIANSLSRGVALAMGLKSPRRGGVPAQKTYVEQSWSAVQSTIILSAARAQQKRR